MEEPLDEKQIEQFVNEEFIRINNVFPTTLAEEARNILWKDLPCNRNDPSTWTIPALGLVCGRTLYQSRKHTPTIQSV